MFRRNAPKVIAVLMLLSFVLVSNITHAGVFSDVKLWFKERAEIRQHSRVISNEVKTLYRERKSIKNFAEGAATLVNAYKKISSKSAKANLPELLQIAKAITQVVGEYQNLAPKAEAMYQKAEPSMKYFSGLADQTNTIQTARNRIMVKGFSDKRVNSLAGANGWNRVWGAVKDNPLNLFKWGRLRDEYKMGKVEAKYPLKCAQIAFEATAYFAAARQSVNELLSIKSEIDGIMGGKLDAILNMNSTLKKIQGAGSTAESLGELAEKGSKSIANRFVELVQIQQEYVNVSKEYNNKYKKQPQTGEVSTSQGVYSSGSAQPPATTDIRTNSSSMTLQQAMNRYQKAYANYIKISQNGNANQNAINDAITELKQARRRVELLQQAR